MFEVLGHLASRCTSFWVGAFATTWRPTPTAGISSYSLMGRCLTLPWGTDDPQALRAAVEVVRGVREAVGPDVRLMLDLGGGDTIQFCREVDEFDIANVEEPIDPATSVDFSNSRRRSRCRLQSAKGRTVGPDSVICSRPDQ